MPSSDPGPGLGMFVCIAFILLILTIVTQSCTVLPLMPEGFASPTKKPVPQAPMADPLPAQPIVTTSSDLISAPITGLSDSLPRPAQDPAQEKVTRQDLAQMNASMESFVARKLQGLSGRSDPDISLRVSQFRGDFQRVKDELASVTKTPGLTPTLTRNDLDTMESNLRLLERLTSQVEEGFADSVAPGPDDPITPDQLVTLSQKLSIEAKTLQASGTSDPVTATRVTKLTAMRQRVDDMITALKEKRLTPDKIPIKNRDIARILPQVSPFVDVGKEPPRRHPHKNPRGLLEETFENLEANTGALGRFDWETRANDICKNIKRADLNPAEYGCFGEDSGAVSDDYSWRGHAKMVCTRLATNADPAVPEQMGCPPASWNGWRL